MAFIGSGWDTGAWADGSWQESAWYGKDYTKAFTRLGLSAVPRQRYGSFAGKASATGRVMSSLADSGGLAYRGGIAGVGGGLAA